MAPIPKDIRVPDGWSIEWIQHNHDQLLLRSPRGYMATIDLEFRGFRSGLVSRGRMMNAKPFVGRGWRKALTDAAVAHLRAIEES